MQTISMGMYDFLKEYGMPLIGGFLDPKNPMVNVLHNSGDPLTCNLLNLLRKPYPAQADVIEGVIKYLMTTKGHACGGVNGQMGTGKSLIGTIAAGCVHLKSKRKKTNVVVAAPPTLMDKWAREIEITLDNAHPWVWSAEFRRYVLAGEKAPKAKGVYVIRDLDETPYLVRTIKKTEGAYEMEKLEDRYDGINFYMIPYTVLRMHYHSQSYIPSGFSESGATILGTKRPTHGDSFLQQKLTERTIRRDGLVNELDDVLARCPRCGSYFEETKRSATGVTTTKYLTVEELQKKNGTIRCQAPRFKKNWKSTPSISGKDPVCGEVFKTNRVLKVVDPEVIAADPENDELTELVTPHKLSRMVSPAYRYAKKLKRRGAIHLAIMDEVHSLKNDGPQGQTGRWLMTAAQKTLSLTGTLTGGYAKDLFYLLWAIAAKDMKRLGFRYSDLGRFEAAYGSKEVTVTTNNGKVLKGKAAISKIKREKKVRKLPGISGQIYADFLVDKFAFLQMSDMHHSLPAYNEYLELVDLSPEMEKVYTPLVNDFKAAMARILQRDKKDFAQLSGLVSSAMHVWTSWLDCLRATKVEAVGKKGKSKKGKKPNPADTISITLSAPDVDIEVTPKELRIMEIVEQNKLRGRKVLVYLTYTGDYNCADRLVSVMTNHGFKVANLTSKVPAKKREKWILENTADADVMVVNPELVKEGLDLLQFPTIIDAQPIVNLYTHRQAMARSWRLGQTEVVECYFIGYRATIQEKLMALIASKLDSALLAEGCSSDSALFEISYSPDSILREMVKAIIAGSEDLLELTTLGRRTNVELAMAMSAEDFAASGFVPAEDAPEPGTPIITTALKMVDNHGAVKTVFVNTYQKIGKKKVRVSKAMTEEEIASMGSPAQLCLFDLSAPALAA